MPGCRQVLRNLSHKEPLLKPQRHVVRMGPRFGGAPARSSQVVVPI